MAGKNTFKDGLHHTRIGRVVPNVELTLADWDELHSASSHAFDQQNRDEINHRLSMFREEFKWNRENPSFQDVKRTLKAILNSTPDEAVIAARNCDAYTIAYMDDASWRLMGLRKFADEIPGEQVKTAAALALENLPSIVGGRPSKSHLKRLAEYCYELWQATGNDSAKAWHNGYGDSSPIVRFAVPLFAKVQGFEQDPSHIAALLRDQTR